MPVIVDQAWRCGPAPAGDFYAAVAPPSSSRAAARPESGHMRHRSPVALRVPAAFPSASYPRCPDALPPHAVAGRAYDARFARSAAELHAAQRLRFDVFNLELGEGLASSFDSGLDRDDYDDGCHHLLVTPSGAPEEIVGTYRMQTSAMARDHIGFYSGSEFDLSALPPAMLDNAVELGRACIAAPHRHTQVLMLLWRAIAQYLTFNDKHFLFGCCSVSTQDEELGWRIYQQLRLRGAVDERYQVVPHAGYALREPIDARDHAASSTAAAAAKTQPADANPDAISPADARAAEEDEVVLPPLMRLYLRYGGRVCGAPAIDRRFGTIDFLVLFDVASLSEERFRTFFGAA